MEAVDTTLHSRLYNPLCHCDGRGSGVDSLAKNSSTAMLKLDYSVYLVAENHR